MIKKLRRLKTHAVLYVRLVALDLAVDPCFQDVYEVVQGLVDGGMEGAFVEVVGGFVGRGGRGQRRRKSSTASPRAKRLFCLRF